MSKRRDALQAMMAPIQTATPAPRPAAASGSLKAMGLSLKSMSDDADETRALRAQLAAGAQVVELDPELVDPSFIRDRLENGEDFEAFKASLAEDGQQVPILVRPTENGRYQAAYGHRRVAALKILKLPVKAVVRDLSDDQLILAQGKENSDRRDLSFIERALYAARLEDHGVARTALISALSLQKGNLSTMITVARSIPEELIVAIGPAPKIGRPRWEQLAGLIGNDKWRAATEDSSFASLPSDTRFERVLKALLPKKPQVVQAGKLKIAKVQHSQTSTQLTIDERQTPEFGAYLIEQLPEIYAAFQRRSDA